MASLRELHAKQDATREELRALDAAAGADGALSDEQQARWAALEVEMNTLRQAERRQALLDDLERRAAGTPISGTGDSSYDRQFADVGLLDVIRAQAGGTDTRAMKARELSRELERRGGRKAEGLLWDMRLEQRTVTTTTPVGGPGGTLIGNAVRPDLFIERLQAATAIRQLGARFIGDLVGNITLPRLDKSVVAAWTPENSEFPVSDPELSSFTLSPRHYGVITELSRNMLQQASRDAEELVRADQARVLAAGLDAAAIAGTGADAQPLGIVNTAGVHTVAAGGVMDYDEIADLMGAVADANVVGGASGFLGSTAVRRAAMKVKDSAGNPLGLGVMFQGQPFAASNLVPAGTLVYSGDWRDLIVATWSTLDVLVNPYAEGPYRRGNVMIRSVLTIDIGVRHPESFAVATGIA